MGRGQGGDQRGRQLHTPGLAQVQAGAGLQGDEAVAALACHSLHFGAPGGDLLQG